MCSDQLTFAEYMAKILVLNGPNLNLLGTREPTLYGVATLTQILNALGQIANSEDHEVEHLQSNAEHKLVEAVQKAPSQGVDFILLNPAAFTHTSIALRDALAAVSIPFIEIHLSNIHARESFRAQSYFSDLAVGVISGFGAQGYELALRAAMKSLSQD